MSVKLKSILLVCASFFSIMIFTFIIFNTFLNSYMDKTQTDNINKAYISLNSIINQERENMKRTVSDWSHWNDTYNFMNGKDKESYIEDNISGNALKELNLNFMFFISKENKVGDVFSQNLSNSAKDKLTSTALNINRTMKFKNNNDIQTGILNISGKNFIVAFSPITASNENGDSNGTLVIARYMDKPFINYINSIIVAKVDIKQNVSSKGLNNKIEKDEDTVTQYRILKDLSGSDSILCSISVAKEEYTLGRYFTIYFLVSLFITVVVTLLILNKYVLSRLKYVNNFIDEVSATRDTSSRLIVDGNDEISNIANSTNKMLEELNSAQKNILKLSYWDKLTGLKNRVYVESRFDDIDNNLNLNYSIILADINGLKIVNDTFGHREGDRLICTIGHILKKVCLEDDIIARWGGDEFIILILNKSNDYLLKLIKDIKAECENIEDFSFKISITLGNAEKDEESSAEAVMNLAEERMYRAKLTDAKSSRNATIISLERTLYEKNRETEEHTRRVKELTTKLGKELNLSQDELNELELLSLLHDIGKIGIPDYILSKPTKLTDEEWKIMKEHTEIGYRIAQATPGLKHVANEILSHHERFDGTGYPQGLKGEEIPILSRIINVVDSFDVMTHKRIYKGAFDNRYAVEELKRCSGTQFDPQIVKEFIEILKIDKRI